MTAVLRAGVAVVAVAAVLALGATGPAAAVDGEAGDRAVQALRSGMNSAGVPGAGLVIVDPSGNLVAEGLGTAGDDRDVSARTPFVIGSTAKSVTALAVMQLVDDGAVDLDAPVRRYLKELRLGDSPAAGLMTVRHLLQQTSGIPETAGGPVIKSAQQGTALDAIRELRGTRLASAPGAEWHYANANYILAGLVVERASGVPYAEHVQRRILTPLGMTRSATTAREARRLGVATGHRRWFGVTLPYGPTIREGVQSAGYLVSTAEDMGRYLAMYLRDGLTPDGTRIVSAEGLRTLTTPGPDAHLGAWADDASARYAMGWFVGGPWQEPVIFHPGNTPDSTAMITLLPERGIAVATLLNLSHELPVPGNPSVTDRVSRAVVDAVLDEPARQPDGAGPSTSRFYTAFDLAVLLLVGAAGWDAWRAVRATRRRRLRHRVRAVLGITFRVVAGALLLALPAAIGYGWQAAWLWAPDLTLVVAALAALLTMAAALRLVTLVRPGRDDVDAVPGKRAPSVPETSGR